MSTKITKERVEKCLNDLTSVARDLLGEVNVFDTYSAGDIIKNVRLVRSDFRYLAESILNKKEPSPTIESKKYISIQLEKSLSAASDQIEKLNKGAKNMDDYTGKITDSVIRRGRKNGAGRGKGMPGGLRRNKNNNPCSDDNGPGYGKGGGRGLGRNR